jgi:hypothetical protein
MFWNKKTPTKLTAYTWDASIFANYPPTYKTAKKNPIPNWLRSFKSLGKKPDPVSGILTPTTDVRTCPGIREFINQGIQFYNWQDTIIQIRPDGTFTYSIPQASKHPNVSFHPKEQYQGAYSGERMNVKLASPWYFACNKPINFVWVESHYSSSILRDNNILLPPGIVNYHKQHSTNVNLMFEIRDETYDVDFKMGEPLATLFPMTEEDIEFSCELVSREEWENIITLPYAFKSRYHKQFEPVGEE